jgi:hypothetical protein
VMPSKRGILRTVIGVALTVAMMNAISWAKDPLPEAPAPVATASGFIPDPPVMIKSQVPTAGEGATINKTFLGLAVVSTGSAFADSYTTLFARENWLAGKKGVCNEEVESAYLYGKHPTVARTYAVATVKSAGSILAAYYMKKHHNRLHGFWGLPLIANSLTSLQGVTQNMIVCN